MADDSFDSAPASKDPADRPPQGPLGAAVRNIRNQVASGVLVSLPVVITFWIFYWLYTTLRRILLDPLAGLYQSILGKETLRALPPWWEKFFAPVLAMMLVVGFLYILGHFARSRLFRMIDWLLQRVPIVTVVYKAVRNVFRSLESQHVGGGYQRVVLVPFPHPGSRALGFVTRTLRDRASGRTILCVCVLTGVVPPAGFTLFVPEEDVIDVDWPVNQTLQVIVSWDPLESTCRHASLSIL